MPPKKPNKADAIEELCDMIEKRKLKAQTALTKAIDARSIDLMRCVLFRTVELTTCTFLRHCKRS